MENQIKSGEIQSRREFFKKAAKNALPILGVAALASIPMMTEAAETKVTSCNGSCTGSCSKSCDRTCSGSCKGSCETSCDKTCKGSCKGSCETSCDKTCKGSCKGYK